MSHTPIVRAFAHTLFSTLILWHTATLAEPYLNKEKHYSVNIDAPWSAAKIPDPSADVFARCDPKVCGPNVLMSFGAIFDSNLRGRTLNDLLKTTNGNTITQELTKLPMVSTVKIINEGNTKIGGLRGHEVLLEITLKDGRKRMRRTLFSTRDGFVYTINIGSPPGVQNQALDAAKSIILTFQTI